MGVTKLKIDIWTFTPATNLDRLPKYFIKRVSLAKRMRQPNACLHEFPKINKRQFEPLQLGATTSTMHMQSHVRNIVAKNAATNFLAYIYIYIATSNEHLKKYTVFINKTRKKCSSISCHKCIYMSLFFFSWFRHKNPKSTLFLFFAA